MRHKKVTAFQWSDEIEVQVEAVGVIMQEEAGECVEDVDQGGQAVWSLGRVKESLTVLMSSWAWNHPVPKAKKRAL